MVINDSLVLLCSNCDLKLKTLTDEKLQQAFNF